MPASKEGNVERTHEGDGLAKLEGLERVVGRY